MVQELIHKAIVDSCDEVDGWFRKQKGDMFCPFYSSFDIRDSSYKVAPVDANLYPAGFNNICQVDKESTAELVKHYLADHYPKNSKSIVLLTEEHTANPYYWDNVLTLKALIQNSGRDVRLTFPRPLPEPIRVESASGTMLTVHPYNRQGGTLEVDGLKADLIISNNDFSVEAGEFLEGLETPINPPYELGWHRRRKDQFFNEYNKLATDFAKLIGVDPFHLTVETLKADHFDVNDEDSRAALADKVDSFLKSLAPQYEKRGLSTTPFAFVKNIAGTYGLGVVQVRSGEDVRQWNYKSRKKMKAAKGGRDVEAVVIQEGIPTVMTSPAETAEPVLYMVGCQLAGGFLRTHSEKGPEDSLNSPGAVFKRLCVSDLKVDIEGCPMENVYGWVARLSFLALGREIKTAGIRFPGYAN